VIGAIGVIVLSLVFSYEWDWMSLHDIEKWLDTVSTSGAFILGTSFLYWIFLGYRVLTVDHSHRWIRFVYFLYPVLLAVFGVVLNFYWVFNLFVLSLGILSIVNGAQRSNLARLNWGMGILAILLLLRLFDTGLGFVFKGIAFILIGAAFLIANIFISKHFKNSASGQ
jgi:hypothetical protein